jgi:hypothetical protein
VVVVVDLMKSNESRRVHYFPLIQLWNRDEINIPNIRVRDLTRNEVEAIYLSGKLRLVVAQCGAPLLWLPLVDTESFWRRPTEHAAYHHTLEFHGQKPQMKGPLDYFCYASDWGDFEGSRLVLLESVFASSGKVPPLPN